MKLLVVAFGQRQFAYDLPTNSIAISLASYERAVGKGTYQIQANKHYACACHFVRFF